MLDVSFKIKDLCNRGILFIFTLIFSSFNNNIYSQSSIENIERDNYILLNNILSDGLLDGVKVSIKILPAVSNNGCDTKNFIAFQFEGNLSKISRFVTFDLTFKDCNSTSYIKTISIPLSENDLRFYLNFNDFSSSNYLSKILGIDDSHNMNDHFNFKSESIDRIDNVKLTSNYQGGRLQRENQLEQPRRIYAYNAAGEENTSFDRAEINSRIRLSIAGGFIPRGGYWKWFDDEELKNEIGRGAEISYTIVEYHPEKIISVVGFDHTGRLKTIPVNRNIYAEVKRALLNEIEQKLKMENLEQAFQIVNDLKKSYTGDNEIKRKYDQIIELIKHEEQKKEEEALQDVLSNNYVISTDFPECDNEIKREIQSLLNYKIFSNEINSGAHNIVLDYYHKPYVGYRFTSKVENDINYYLVDFLNSKSKSFYKPKIKYSKDKYTEVNAFDEYVLNIYIKNLTRKVNKKNGSWVSKDSEFLDQIHKNYGVKNYLYPDGTYSISFRNVIVNNTSYYQTSGECVKGVDGPQNMLKAAFFSPQARTNVGLKNGKIITFSIIGLTVLSTAGKLFSNAQYDKFLKAYDQKSVDSYYQQANLSNKVFLISAGLGVTLYSYNLISVFSKGKQNSKKISNNKILPSKNDFILFVN